MTINITLDETFSISADSRQWFLSEKGCSSTYYRDLESLIKYYFNKKVWASNCQSIQELILFYKTLSRACNVALAPLNIKVEGVNSQVRPNKLVGGKK